MLLGGVRTVIAWAAVGVVAVAIGALLICTTPFHQHNPGVMQFHDTNYQFRCPAITEGTNHNFYTGNVMLGVMRTFICQCAPPLAGCFRFMQASWYSPYQIQTNKTTVLWICWTRKGDGYYTDPSKNGPLRLSCTDFNCFLDTPDGQSERLAQFTAAESPFTKESVCAWELPSSATNGCTIRLIFVSYPKKEAGEMVLR